MVILTKTPLRITFFGGGSDYPTYFKNKRGFCINAAIDKYSYTTVRTLAGIDNYKFRVCYKKTELVEACDQIEQPVVRAALRRTGLAESRLEIHYFSDLPSASGLGSSSSFACGLLGGLRYHQGNPISGTALARDAWELEAEDLGETVGVQDQYAAALGGIQALEMSNAGVYSNQIPFDDFTRDLSESLMLIFTSRTRLSQSAIRSQLDTFRLNTEVDPIAKSVDLADEAWRLISRRRGVAEIGAMLSEAWEIKRRFGEGVSDPAIDELYDRIIKCGARGAKLIGAGGGGFFLVSACQQGKKNLLKKFGSNNIVFFSFSDKGFELLKL